MIDVRWRGYTHDEIYRIVHTGPGHAASAQAQAIWPQVEQRLRVIDENLATETTRLGGGWEGAAAEATREGLTPLGEWAAQAVNGAQRTAGGVDQQAQYVADMRNSVPPPGAPISAEVPPSLNDPGLDPFFQADWAAQDVERDRLAQQAVHAMDVYTDNSVSNKPHMYAMATPPAVAADTAPMAAASTGGVAGYGDGSGAGTAPASAVSATSSTSSAPSGGPGAAAPVRVEGTAGPAFGVLPAGSGSTPAGPGGRGVGALPGTGPSGGGVGIGSGGIGAGGIGSGRPGAAASGGGGSGGIGIAGAKGSAVAPQRSPAGARTGAGAVGAGGGRAPSGAFRPVVPRVPDRAPAPPNWRTDPTILRPPGSVGQPGTGSRWTAEPGSRLPGGTGPGGGTAGGGGTGSGGSGSGGRSWAETGARGAAPERPVPPGDGTRGTGSRPGAGHPGVMPRGGGVGAGNNQEHRRPHYLVDDSDAFADDRWVTDAVLTPDNGPPNPGGG